MKLVFLEIFSDDLKKISDKKVKKGPLKKLFSELNQLSHWLTFQGERNLKVKKMHIACELVITVLDLTSKMTPLYLRE